jgi:hypothetical protein
MLGWEIRLAQRDHKPRRRAGIPNGLEVWEVNHCAFCGKPRWLCDRLRIGLTAQHVRIPRTCTCQGRSQPVGATKPFLLTTPVPGPIAMGCDVEAIRPSISLGNILLAPELGPRGAMTEREFYVTYSPAAPRAVRIAFCYSARHVRAAPAAMAGLGGGP